MRKACAPKLGYWGFVNVVLVALIIIEAGACGEWGGQDMTEESHITYVDGKDCSHQTQIDCSRFS